MVELARGVCVDGVGAGGFADVHWYQVGLAAAYYYDFCWGGEGFEEGGGNGGGEGAEVFLTVLYTPRTCQLRHSRDMRLGERDRGRRTPQKKCRIKMIRTLRAPCSLSAYKLLNV